MNTEIKVSIKPYSPGELATQYGVSTKTLRTWLKLHNDHIGTRVGKYFTALQIRIIYERIGVPGLDS
jgi:transposase-like protein